MLVKVWLYESCLFNREGCVVFGLNWPQIRKTILLRNY